MKKVLIAGGSGLIGSRLTSMMQGLGYEIGILTRSKKADESIKWHQWNPQNGDIDSSVLEYDYVINLAGAGIADKKWSDVRKKEILDSRLKSTALLVDTFKQSEHKLKGVVSASAIGFYGDAGELVLTEDTPSQTDEFVVEVCKAWEDVAKEFASVSDRLSILRIGTVLAKDGGALPKMAMGIRLGMANYLGSGAQWMSWIHIEDICRQIVFLLEDGRAGVFNGVSPEPVTNKTFTKLLRKEVNPISLLLPAPEFAVRMIVGELGDLVFNSNRVSANKIIGEGFQFKYPSLEMALADIYK